MTDHHQEHLKTYLTDAYSIEQQALAQLRKAHEVAGEPSLAQHLKEHLVETERQAEMVEARLRAVGGSPSKVKDAVMRLGGKGFLLFARMQPDTPGKLAAHTHSYEALEFAAYEMLIRMARRAGDEETAQVATEIRDQERAMRDRIAGDLAQAADASLRATNKAAADTLDTYLADAHALEMQSIQLLKRGRELAGDPGLGTIYEDHLDETAEHARLVEQRLDSMGENASVVKDTALRAGAVNWSLFFQAQGDTPAKLAAFVYAVEHLEIAGYELLRHVGESAGASEIVELANRIANEERAMADRVFAAFDQAFEATVSGAGVST